MKYYSDEIKDLNHIIKQSDLLKKNNTTALIHIMIRLFIQIILFYICFSFRNDYFLFIITCIPYFFCFSFFGMAGISHELLHNNVFTSKKLNRFFFIFFMVLSFSNYGYFEYTHWLHHKKTLSEDDPKDIFKGKLKIKQIFFWFFIDIPSFVKRVRILIFNSFGIIPNSVPERKKLNILQSSRFVLLFHFSIFLISFISKYYIVIILINIAPFTFTFFNKVLAINQHYLLNNNDCDSDDYAFNTRTILLKKYLSFFYANMNYHVEHHYFPAIPFYNLPQAHSLIYFHLNYSNFERGLKKSLKRLLN
jgi:fatty acid desaturase